MYLVHLSPPLCLHLLMQGAEATAHPWFNRDTEGHSKFLHCRSLRLNTVLKGNSQCPLTALPRRNPAFSLTLGLGQAHRAQSLSCHAGRHGRGATPSAMPARQHRLHWPRSLCQVPGLPRSVRPALAGGWGRRRWKRSAPSGTRLPSLRSLSG